MTLFDQKLASIFYCVDSHVPGYGRGQPLSQLLTFWSRPFGDLKVLTRQMLVIESGLFPTI